MDTTFILNGGAGRIVCAIPALEKFAKLNPTDNFKVLLSGWDSLYWSHPLLQSKTVSVDQRGVFEAYIKNNKIVAPEPYFVYGYYNGILSISEAFDELINTTTNHSDLTRPTLYLSSLERISIKRIVTELKTQFNKSKLVVIQPFGSGASLQYNQIYDSSHRSLTTEAYLHIVSRLPKDCLSIYFGPPELKPETDVISVDLRKFTPDIRMFMSLISECSYFIGCDSVGQHIAYSFNKPGTVFMGSTLESNASYVTHFKFIRKADRVPTYYPIRFGIVESDLVDRLNDEIMNFSLEELDKACDSICTDLSLIG